MILNGKYKELLKTLSSEAPFKPDIAIVLGSGLGEFAGRLNIIKSIRTKDLPSYPLLTVPGHQGMIYFAEYENKNILLFQGRVHIYEGYLISECVLPVLISKELGCRSIILTNVAGGINLDFSPGSLVLISSFITLQIKRELINILNIPDLPIKSRFSDFPSSSLNNIIKQSAYEENIPIKEGVYYYVKGPCYETPAEIEMIKRSGGDLVGMSTAYEAVFASLSGMETAAISIITNYAAGISAKKLLHEDVTEMAGKTINLFERLIKQTIKNIIH